MIGSAIDSLIGVFSPGWQAKRMRERAVVRAMGGYESGKHSRTHDLWAPSNRSADSEYLAHGPLTRARARDLYRNNAYGRAIVRAWVRNVVGSGVRPQSRTESDDFNMAAEDLFRQWAPVADVTGRLHYYQIQAQILTEMLVAGEVLVHFVEDNYDYTRPVPFALEVIDVDRLADDTMTSLRTRTQNGNQIRMGIEYDSGGRPVAYHVRRSHPNDILTTRDEPVRIPAENMLHIYLQDRVGQSRGISMFAPIVWWMKNLGSYVENEVISSAIAACFGVVIKTVDGGNAPGLGDQAAGDSTSDSVGNTFNYMEPGMVSRLLPGEDIETFNPNRNASGQGEFVNLMLRSMATASGLGFERVSRDYSKTNYSSNRASDLEDRREFEQMEYVLDWQLNKPVWKRLMMAGCVEGFDGFPNAMELLMNQDAWLRSEWSQISPHEWVDPQKEATADDIGLKNKSLSHGDIVKKRTGREYAEHLAVLQREQEERDKAGVELVLEDQTAGQQMTEEAQNAT